MERFNAFAHARQAKAFSNRTRGVKALAIVANAQTDLLFIPGQLYLHLTRPAMAGHVRKRLLRYAKEGFFDLKWSCAYSMRTYIDRNPRVPRPVARVVLQHHRQAKVFEDGGSQRLDCGAQFLLCLFSKLFRLDQVLLRALGIARKQLARGT